MGNGKAIEHMRRRLRYQFLVPLILLLLGVVAISTWTALSSVHHARQQLDLRVRRVAQTLYEAPDFPLSAPVLTHMKRLSGAEYLLVTEDGARLSTLKPTDFPLPKRNATPTPWHAVHLDQEVEINGAPYLFSTVQLQPPKEKDILYIFYPESAWRDLAWQAIRPSLFLGSFLGVASILLTLSLGAGLTRRVQELERRTRQIAAGDFDPMPLPTPDDEIRDLSGSINDMAQRLQALQETVQRTERLRLLGQVSGGLAHQLRNGLTGARLSLQLFARDQARWEAGQGKPADAAAVDVALRQLNLLEAHLKRFLDLGRPREAQMEPCSMANIVDETLTLLEPRSRHAGIEIRAPDSRQPWAIIGDKGQLQELLLNVLTNAVEAAGANGWVALDVTEADANRLQIAVRDSGPGPDVTIAGKLFEPLITGKPEGVGLGLAVSQQIAGAHGGCITWSREDDCTLFLIELSADPLQKNLDA